MNECHVMKSERRASESEPGEEQRWSGRGHFLGRRLEIGPWDFQAHLSQEMS